MTTLTHSCPPIEELTAALVANGHSSGLRKHVLDGEWWQIDESSGPAGIRTKSAITPDDNTAVARCRSDVEPEMLAGLLAIARGDGWKVSEGPEGARIDLNLKRRARAGLFLVEREDFSPSLAIEILSEPGIPGVGLSAFVLRLSAFLRLVRASLLDFGSGPRLVWEVPLDPQNTSEDSFIEALSRLAGAVRNGQAEAELIARDNATAVQWLGMNFSQPRQ